MRRSALLRCSRPRLSPSPPHRRRRRHRFRRLKLMEQWRWAVSSGRERSWPSTGGGSKRPMNACSARAPRDGPLLHGPMLPLRPRPPPPPPYRRRLRRRCLRRRSMEPSALSVGLAPRRAASPRAARGEFTPQNTNAPLVTPPCFAACDASTRTGADTHASAARHTPTPTLHRPPPLLPLPRRPPLPPRRRRRRRPLPPLPQPPPPPPCRCRPRLHRPAGVPTSSITGLASRGRTGAGSPSGSMPRSAAGWPRSAAGWLGPPGSAATWPVPPLPRPPWPHPLPQEYAAPSPAATARLS